jgi:hypothetical protein
VYLSPDLERSISQSRAARITSQRMGKGAPAGAAAPGRGQVALSRSSSESSSSSAVRSITCDEKETDLPVVGRKPGSSSLLKLVLGVSTSIVDVEAWDVNEVLADSDNWRLGDAKTQLSCGSGLGELRLERTGIASRW